MDKRNKIIIVFIILILVVVGIFMFARNKNATSLKRCSELAEKANKTPQETNEMLKCKNIIID